MSLEPADLIQRGLSAAEEALGWGANHGRRVVVQCLPLDFHSITRVLGECGMEEERVYGVHLEPPTAIPDIDAPPSAVSPRFLSNNTGNMVAAVALVEAKARELGEQAEANQRTLYIFFKNSATGIPPASPYMGWIVSSFGGLAAATRASSMAAVAQPDDLVLLALTKHPQAPNEGMQQVQSFVRHGFKLVVLHDGDERGRAFLIAVLVPPGSHCLAPAVSFERVPPESDQLSISHRHGIVYPNYRTDNPRAWDPDQELERMEASIVELRGVSAAELAEDPDGVYPEALLRALQGQAAVLYDSYYVDTAAALGLSVVELTLREPIVYVGSAIREHHSDNARARERFQEHLDQIWAGTDRSTPELTLRMQQHEME